MADDFADLRTSPVINVKWWGSYLENEIMEPVVRFLIAFETDIPAVGQPGDIDYIASHPGEVIQAEIVHLSTAIPLNPGEYSETNIGSGGAPCYEALFEYEAELLKPFPQDPNTVYWIKIVAMMDIDYITWQQLQTAVLNSGKTFCEFMELPFAQQQSFGLETPLTRWGWHNRDYTVNDPYASTPPAVIPGEHIAGQVIYPDTLPRDVWHFQDDAVSGEVFINDFEPEYPFVDQPTWQEEYYKYSLPYCASPPPGVDGPDEIEQFSKDLAFELWTNNDCIPSTHPDYPEWVLLGKPPQWCAPNQCYGDADGLTEPAGRSTVAVGFVDIAVLLDGLGKAYVDPVTTDWIGADFTRSAEAAGRSTVRVGFLDINVLLLNLGTTPPGDCN